MKPSNIKDLSPASRGLLYRFKFSLQRQKIFLIDICRPLLVPKWVINKSDLQTIFQKSKSQFSSSQVEQLFTELMDAEKMTIEFTQFKSIYEDITMLDNPDIKINEGKNPISEYILKSEEIQSFLIDWAASNNGIIEKVMIQDILSNLNFKSREEQQFKNEIFGDNEWVRLEQLLQNIRQTRQGNLLGKASTQISYIEQIAQNIRKLKKYFNYESKLDKEFAKIAVHYLNNGFIYKDQRHIDCKYAKNVIILEEDTAGYFLFSNAEELVVGTQKQSGLKRCLRPNDIIQGQIGDCCFLSTMAALAFKYPQLIYRLFVLLKNPSHLYGVRLFIDGEWKTVPLDLQFPMNQNLYFCGAGQNDQNIWPMLLQKAYAKVNGSYNNIQSITDEEGIQAMTGAPSIQYKTIKPAFWGIAAEQCQRGSILTASIEVGKFSQEVLEMFDLTPKHSYSILQVFDNIQARNNQLVTLIKLRNPWGRDEKTWKGPWSLLREEWTHSLRKQLKYKLDPKDGSFFMCQQDFQHVFTNVNICRVELNNTNSWLDLDCTNDKFMAVRIKIKRQGNYAFTTYLKDKRQYPKDPAHSARQSWIFLLKKQGQKYKRVCCNYARTKNNTLDRQKSLDEGEYMLLIRLMWVLGLQFSYRLTSYGPQQVWMQQQPYLESYLRDYIQSGDQIVQSKLLFQNKNIYKKEQFHPKFGYGFIEIENQQKSTFDVQIDFEEKQQKFTKVLEPHKFPLHLRVAPGQVVNCKFIIRTDFMESKIKYDVKQLEPEDAPKPAEQ